MTNATTEQRLAALRARRGLAEDSPPTPGTPPPHPARGRPGRGAHRRSPAAASKILLAGASTSAVFGVVAAMGLADRSAAGEEEEIVDAPADSVAAVPDTVATAPASEPVVVVVLDAEGTPLATTTLTPIPAGPAVVTLDYLATDPAPVEPERPSRKRRAAPEREDVDLEQVAVPVVVDVAVPAPPVPRAPSASSPGPAPATATAPAPLPPSEGTSSGS